MKMRMFCIGVLMCVVVLGIIASAPAGAAVIFQDTFTHPDGVDPDWSVLSGTWQVTGGTYDDDTSSASTWPPVVSVATGLNVGDCRIDVDSGNMYEDSVMFRVQDADNYMFVQIHAWNLWWYLVAGGQVTQLDDTAVAWSDGANHAGEAGHYTLTCTGDTYTLHASSSSSSATMDAALTFTAPWTSGGVGLGAGQNHNNPYLVPSPGPYDNFTVSDNSPAGSVAGQIELLDFHGDLSLCPVRIELTPKVGGIYQKREFTLTTNPQSYLISPVTPGTYDVTFSSTKVLRKVVTVDIVGGSTTATANANLVNGDVDGDNSVTSTDVSTVIKSIDQVGN